MDALSALIGTIPDFHNWNHVKKIKLFTWFLHSQGKEHFSSTDIRLIYEKLHLEKPANITSQLDQLAEKTPKELLKKQTDTPSSAASGRKWMANMVPDQQRFTSASS